MDETTEASTIDNEALYQSDYHEWETPPAFFTFLDEQFEFTLDPCCRPQTAKCDMYYTPEDDGLSQDWSGNRVFVNPPYGHEIKDWVEKCRNEAESGAESVVMLIPARTDTRYWHDHVMQADELWLVKGRLKFHKYGEEQDSATFPSAVVVFNNVSRSLPKLRQLVKRDGDYKLLTSPQTCHRSLEEFDQNSGDTQ